MSDEASLTIWSCHKTIKSLFVKQSITKEINNDDSKLARHDQMPKCCEGDLFTIYFMLMREDMKKSQSIQTLQTMWTAPAMK